MQLSANGWGVSGTAVKFTPVTMLTSEYELKALLNAQHGVNMVDYHLSKTKIIKYITINIWKWLIKYFLFICIRYIILGSLCPCLFLCFLLLCLNLIILTLMKNDILISKACHANWKALVFISHATFLELLCVYHIFVGLKIAAMDTNIIKLHPPIFVIVIPLLNFRLTCETMLLYQNFLQVMVIIKEKVLIGEMFETDSSFCCSASIVAVYTKSVGQ